MKTFILFIASAVAAWAWSPIPNEFPLGPSVVRLELSPHSWQVEHVKDSPRIIYRLGGVAEFQIIRVEVPSTIEGDDLKKVAEEIVIKGAIPFSKPVFGEKWSFKRHRDAVTTTEGKTTYWFERRVSQRRIPEENFARVGVIFTEEFTQQRIAYLVTGLEINNHIDEPRHFKMLQQIVEGLQTAPVTEIKP